MQKLKKIFLLLKSVIIKIGTSLYFKLIIALTLIIPSLYDILDNTTKIRKEHLILAFGLFLFVKYLKELFDKILYISEEIE